MNYIRSNYSTIYLGTDPKKAPYKGLSADSKEEREPVSDIDTAALDSLKVLDPTGRLEKRTLGVLAFFNP